jgi:hypothetical protein
LFLAETENKFVRINAACSSEIAHVQIALRACKGHGVDSNGVVWRRHHDSSISMFMDSLTRYVSSLAVTLSHPNNSAVSSKVSVQAETKELQSAAELWQHYDFK